MSRQPHFAVADFHRHRDEPVPTRPADACTRFDRERRAVHGAGDASVAHEKAARRVVEVAARVRAFVVVGEHALARGAAGSGSKPPVADGTLIADRVAVRDIIQSAQRA